MNRQKSGYVLVMVLWTVVILNIIFILIFDTLKLNEKILLNFFEEKKQKSGYLSALNFAVYNLKEDSTEYDSWEDKWYKLGEYSIGDETYKVEIQDMENRFNINYLPKDIRNEFEFWKKEVEKKYKDSKLFYDNSYEKELFKEIPEGLEDIFSVSGKFHFYVESLDRFKLALDRLNKNRSQNEKIINEMRNLRYGRKKIEDPKKLVEKIKSLDYVTSKKLEKYISLDPIFNINFISEDMLKKISKKYMIREKNVKKIIEYRKENSIKKMKELDKVIPMHERSKLDGIFGTYSGRFKVIIKRENRELKVIIERTKVKKNNYKVKIVEMEFKEIMKEDTAFESSSTEEEQR